MADHLIDVKALEQFLVGFCDGSRPPGEQYKYIQELQAINAREIRILTIELDDLVAYTKNNELAARIVENAARFLAIFYKITIGLLDGMKQRKNKYFSAFDEFQDQRRYQVCSIKGTGHDLIPSPDVNDRNAIPLALLRWHEIRLLPPTVVIAGPLRQLKAANIGRLVKVRGIVTRVSDVKPMAEVVTYCCESCGCEIYHDVSSKTDFLPLSKCTSQHCVANKMTGRLFPQSRASKFTKYQELRIQELPVEVPVGHVPRSVATHCRGELTRQCSPGDTVVLCGIFLPRRFSGLKGMKAGLTSDTFLEATVIEKEKKSYFELENDPDADTEIDELVNSRDAYSRLARSIAPEIYGHEDVKKALLLQLVGGLTRILGDGVRLRGDINVCLMGDPGVAKSQLLKAITSLSPRGVYTTGKGSSGVGLTAAVVRDTSTSEISLEGGALVLADCGVCCIDEFDKMDEYDRTAIHEVMEQQTISIAKAGITTTLNARTAVLAAANPLYGRYMRNKTMAENVNLPNSLLSRFDLMFLLLDKPEIESDVALARHVTHVHSFLANPDFDFEVCDAGLLRHYIAQARQFEPFVPTELTGTVIDTYVNWRQSSAKDGQGSATPRQLLSILRLSQALARLRFDDSVNQDDVNEACRLTFVSKASLYCEINATPVDAKSKAFDILRNYANTIGISEMPALNYEKVKNIAIKKAVREEDFLEMLQEYEELGVVYVNAEHTHIEFC